MTKKILDVACASKMFWFDKENKQVLFTDIRNEETILCDGRKLIVKPDKLIDFRKMPFRDRAFSLVVFDPPHLIAPGKKSWMHKKFGGLNKDSWKRDLAAGFSECWRVLDLYGTLVFKWNETQVKIKEVLACFHIKPLFGHTTTQNLKTHWMVFFKGRNK